MAKILVADDNEEMLETLSRIFTFYQFEVELAHNGQEAVDLAESVHPDLIVLDGMMPVMDGFEACKHLKSKSATKDIPIIFLTAQFTDPEHRISGLEMGCDDYMLKPFNSKELVARTRAILKRSEILHYLKSENEQLAENNTRVQNELQKIMQKARESETQSFIDQLTGLYSFSFFEKRLKEEFKRSKRHGSSLSLVAVGINQIDDISEMYGQQVGYYILMKLANALLTHTRTSDVLSSDGNDKFYIILPETDARGAFVEAERIRVVLDTQNIYEDEILSTLQAPRRKKLEIIKLDYSVGVTTFEPTESKIQDEKELLHKALEAQRKARQEGSNRTIAV